MRSKAIATASAATVVLIAVTAVLAAGGQSAFERLTGIRSELASVKSELGIYSCCIRPSCNFCALAAGMCPCGDGVKSEDGVCGECYLGWRAGQGDIPGVDVDDVQPMSGDMLMMMYEMRAEGTAESGAHADSGHRHGSAVAR